MLSDPGVHTSRRTVPLRVKPMSVKKVAPWELQPPSDGPGITRSDAAQNGMIWYSQDLLAVLVHTCHSTLTLHKIHNSHISIYVSYQHIYISSLLVLFMSNIKSQLLWDRGRGRGKHSVSNHAYVRAIKHDMTLNLKTY